MNTLFKLLGLAAYTLVTFAVTLALFWVTWKAWTYAVPALWTSGPEAITRPDYWTFFVAIFLLRTIVGTIFGRSSK